MKFVVSCCLLLFLCTALFAQRDFSLGYVINNQKDSVSGYVLFTESDHPDKCFFRETKNGSTTTFDAGQIEAFGRVGGYRFASIQIDGHDQFAKHILSGKASLFVHRNRFYLLHDELKPLDKSQGTANYYKVVLNEILSQCNLSADASDYSQRHLTNLLKNYNNCASGAFREFKPPDEAFSTSIEVLAAFDMSSYSSGKHNITFDKYNTFAAGAGFDFSWPRVSQRVSVSLECWYSHANFHGYGVYDRSGATHFDDYFLQVSAVRLPLALRISAFAGSNTPYMKFGIVQDFQLANKVKIVRDRVFGGQVNSEIKETRLVASGFPALWGGIGYMRTVLGYRALVEVRLEKTAMGELKETTNPIDRINIKLLLGIRL